MEIGVDDIEKILIKKEEKSDKIQTKSREVVRLCSNAIKAMHAYDMKTAKDLLKKADKEVAGLKDYEAEFRSHVHHILQEYAEAKVVLTCIEKKYVPGYREVGVDVVPYLNGLMDATGELKREMYESLRRGNRHEAEIYFKMMEGIYDALLPLRFSNAVLPDFRRKQDVARIQMEQARGELL